MCDWLHTTVPLLEALEQIVKFRWLDRTIFGIQCLDHERAYDYVDRLLDVYATLPA